MQNKRENNKFKGVPSQIIREKLIPALPGQNAKVQPKKERNTGVYGNKIRAILTEIQMSQQELADLAMDGDKRHLSRIILGKQKGVALSIAFRISHALKRPIEEIFIHKSNN